MNRRKSTNHIERAFYEKKKKINLKRKRMNNVDEEKTT